MSGSWQPLSERTLYEMAALPSCQSVKLAAIQNHYMTPGAMGLCFGTIHLMRLFNPPFKPHFDGLECMNTQSVIWSIIFENPELKNIRLRQGPGDTVTLICHDHPGTHMMMERQYDVRLNPDHQKQLVEAIHRLGTMRRRVMDGLNTRRGEGAIGG
ncbi:MAG: hypothetical protein M1828_001894 [Chrysothrix sp. TS-e1954]|nr:MAG: hypothetical protein M1828_001894 [Chrysothrix sp. TS-e1954]